MNNMNHKEKSQAGIAALQKAFPKLFNADRPKPLAIGIHTQIANARRSGLLEISVLVQRAAMKSWLNKPNYQRALAITEYRYNLDGSAATRVSDDHRQHAIDRLKAMRKAKKARKVAIYQAKMRTAA